MTSQTAAGGRGRGPMTAGLVLLLTALAGGLAGVAVDRLVLLPHMFGGRDFGPRGRHGPPPPNHEFRDRFAHDLGLTDDQQVRIDSIMDRQMREVRAIRSQVQPRVDSIISGARRELDAVLTPEQRQKAEALRKQHPPPPPPPEDGMPGGPDRPPDGPPPR
jgi:Spy/CpxP family protein refolding chaperone